MSNIADKLQDLVTAKADIKAAIESKGVTPTGGLSTYADAIRSIENGDIIIEGDLKLPNNTKFANSEFTEAPVFDTSDYTDMSFMFEDCISLTNVPQYNTSNVTTMYGMFSRCRSLSIIPKFDTSKVTDMGAMFRRTENWSDGSGVALRIPLMDCGNVEYFEAFDHYSYARVKVDYAEGFKDLGKSITEDYRAASSYKNVSFERAILNHDSRVNIINNLYNIASQNKTLTLQMGVADLSDEEIAIATNKGWIISS